MGRTVGKMRGWKSLSWKVSISVSKYQSNWESFQCSIKLSKIFHLRLELSNFILSILISYFTAWKFSTSCFSNYMYPHSFIIQLWNWPSLKDYFLISWSTLIKRDEMNSNNDYKGYIGITTNVSRILKSRIIRSRSIWNRRGQF